MHNLITIATLINFKLMVVIWLVQKGQGLKTIGHNRKSRFEGLIAN